ncbi:MAG: helix-turn-helix domain-containing protein [Patescibacteria group bacterium]
MNHFISNRIVRGKTLGDKLSEAREDRDVSLEKAAKDLNISYKYLLALEENKLSDLPGRAYVRNFLKLYCAYLKLNFNDCWQAARELETIESVKRQGTINKKIFFAWPRLIRRLLLVFLVAAVFVFLVFKVQEIFAPPPLTINTPKDGSMIADKQVQIIGKSQPEVEILINNKNIFVDKNGEFKTTADLQKGLNLIKITAKKRYSRTSETLIRVLLTEAQTP